MSRANPAIVSVGDDDQSSAHLGENGDGYLLTVIPCGRLRHSATVALDVDALERLAREFTREAHRARTRQRLGLPATRGGT